MPNHSVFVDNAGVRLHVLDNGRTSAAPPVVVVPGFGECAQEYAWLLDRLTDRRVLAVDLRGRGRSDAPDAGYAWEDHVGDLAAIVDALELRQPALVAFSRGSSYASATRSVTPAGCAAWSSATTTRDMSRWAGSAPRSSRG